MNWEAISAVAEIVGAFAIFITLAYLAVQIRQSNRSTRLAALEQTASQWHNWSNLLAGSPDLAGIVDRGNQSFGDLSPEERLRYEAYIQMFFDSAESYWSQITDLGIRNDSSELRVLESIVTRRLTIEGFRTAWESIRSDYEGRFQSWIDGLQGKVRNE